MTGSKDGHNKGVSWQEGCSSPQCRSPNLSPMLSPSEAPRSPLQGRSSRKGRRNPESPDNDDASERGSERARSEASTLGEGQAVVHDLGSKRAKKMVGFAAAQKKPSDFSLTPDALRYHTRSQSHRSLQTQPAESPSSRQPQQPKITDSFLQSKSGGKSKLTSFTFLKPFLSDGDGADVLKLSCSLGCLLSLEEKLQSSDQVFYMDASCMLVQKTFRKAAESITPLVQDLLRQGPDKLHKLLEILVGKGMTPLETQTTKDSGKGLSPTFLHGLGQRALNPLGQACACLCLYQCVRKQLLESEDRNPVPELEMSLYQGRPLLSFKYRKLEKWQHFAIVQDNQSLQTKEVKMASLQPLSGSNWLGILMAEFFIDALETPATIRPKEWLEFIVAEESEKQLGVSCNYRFLEAIAEQISQKKLDKCLPHVITLPSLYTAAKSSHQTFIRQQERSAQEFELVCKAIHDNAKAGASASRNAPGKALSAASNIVAASSESVIENATRLLASSRRSQ